MTRMWNPKRQKTLLKHWAAQHHLVLANKFFNKQERCNVRARPRAHERSPVQTILNWRNNGTDRRDTYGTDRKDGLTLLPSRLTYQHVCVLPSLPYCSCNLHTYFGCVLHGSSFSFPCFNHLLVHSAAHATQILLDDLHERRPAIPRP